MPGHRGTTPPLFSDSSSSAFFSRVVFILPPCHLWPLGLSLRWFTLTGSPHCSSQPCAECS
eukprot:91916-Amphidinium_carterae.1